jgi:hypothetical protein
VTLSSSIHNSCKYLPVFWLVLNFAQHGLRAGPPPGSELIAGFLISLDVVHVGVRAMAEWRRRSFASCCLDRIENTSSVGPLESAW